MTTKSKIYTGVGDSGETSLVGGQRVSKSEPQINAYGTVDELNSFIGLAVSLSDNLGDFEVKFIQKIQNNLFNLGSQLATSPGEREKFKLPDLDQNIINEMEVHIDKMDSNLTKLTNFILPGGTQGSSAFHVCRTVCRRLERSLVELSKEDSNLIPGETLKFINRSSDYFFILSRSLNSREGVSDIEWEK